MIDSVKPVMTNPVHFLAFGFGSGLTPKAPGTAGTLTAVVPWLWLSQQNLAIYLSVLSSLGQIYDTNKTRRGES